jgi:Cation/multidrug efflux pump
MKWDGEWHLTIEVFRDLGLAFAAVLVLIYVLVVGWFQSFKTPLLIMAAIPFSLWHPAGARGDGRVLHGHVDDRLHRRCGHRGAQFDHPGGLHRAAVARGLPLEQASSTPARCGSAPWPSPPPP